MTKPTPVAAAVSLLWLLGAACAMPVFAQSESETSESLLTKLSAQQEHIERQNKLLESMLKRIEDLELKNATGRGVTPSSTAASALAWERDTQRMAQSAPAAQSAPGALGQEQQRQQKEDDSRSAAQTLAGKQTPLFDSKFTLDTGVTYTRLDRRQLALSGFYALDAIFLGQLSLDQVKANTLVVDTTARYGLTDRWTLDANIPLIYRNTTFVSEGAQSSGAASSEASVSKFAIGDVSVGASYQFKKEATDGFDMVGSLKLRIPTGTSPFGIELTTPDPNNTNLRIPAELPTSNGVYSLQAVGSFIKTIDPVVVYANVGYIYNIQRNVADLDSNPGLTPGSVRLGNSLLLGGGAAFAVNDTTALSFGVNMQITRSSRTRPDGGEWKNVVGSKGVGATFNMGVNHVLSKNASVNASVGIGLTNDVPNFTLGLRVPYTF
jgi:hypothetical protein